MHDQVEVAFTLNGRHQVVVAESRRNLVDVLRRDLGKVGTRVGCEQGICGSCTVLCDGEPVRSCLMLIGQVDGRAIETIEVNRFAGSEHPLQKFFSEEGALQCGYCTPGFLLLIEGFLNETPDASAHDIREVVAANLCRCTGYWPIIEAAVKYQETLRGGESRVADTI